VATIYFLHLQSTTIFKNFPAKSDSDRSLF
jgi:hypothetical protein